MYLTSISVVGHELLGEAFVTHLTSSGEMRGGMRLITPFAAAHSLSYRSLWFLLDGDILAPDTWYCHSGHTPVSGRRQMTPIHQVNPR
jgi:hypothetical protein